MINKITSKLTSTSVFVVISVVSTIVVMISIPLVYVLVLLFGVEYTNFMLLASIIAPLLMVPGTVYIMIKLSKHLVYFKEALDVEIQKNKKHDLMMFEQARFVLMGEMLANISHQWKQPLNTIGLAIVNARTTEKTKDEVENNFDIMEDNTKYLASTINDFMSFFAHKTNSERRDIDSIIKEIKSIIYTHISNKNIELEITVDKSYGNIEVASSISQVILNLLNNAKDACSKTSKRKEIKLQFTSNEYGLEIECCDNGEGIDEEIKDKIFDPYFTTKEKNQGTGIGLYMSKEIVQKIFAGKIAVSSREYSRSSMYPVDNSGKTCFYIAIPYSKNCVLVEEYE